MKILYIGMKYDYGKPERGFSFEHYNFYDSLVRMNRGENKVIYFPFDEVMNRVGQEEMNRRLLATVEEERPELCFFFLFTEEIKKETIKKISEKSGAITFNWFADDHWRFDNFSRYWAPLFHWVATTDSRAVEKYYKIGYRNVIKTQWACNHFLYRPVATPKIYDLTFVGQPHSDRKKVVERIRAEGLKIECFGYGWPRGRISQEEMIRVFSASKINLNLNKASLFLSSPKAIAKIFLRRAGKFFLPLGPVAIWRNLKLAFSGLREQIKGRNFEIPGCGGFLLTGNADNLEDYYEDGKEIVIFRNTNDLIDKIRYYLEHEKEREEIAWAGYQRTLRDHTYEKRFNEIFKIIFNKQC